MKTKCNYCGRDYATDTHTHVTSSLKSHLRTCKKYPPNLDKAQAILSFKPKDQVVERCMGNTLSSCKMDQNAARNALVCMIIIDEISFKSIESDGFRQLIAVIPPRFTVQSRYTVTRDCYFIYTIEITKISFDSV
ncbi:hypothetical protein CFOL_v3_35963 [Cephalotus follicularis]|uniref:BED-type domain-containing protein n=1 Tax=Cephalotus follicularis TaxID=3775 RepID=A0A1Q3DJL0_CEPFO|nr:hypothetical protein CFOL_v3_35963 [Cephalotus follicularis]